MSDIPEEYSKILSYYLDSHELSGTLTPKVKKLDTDNPYFSYYLYLVSYTYRR